MNKKGDTSIMKNVKINRNTLLLIVIVILETILIKALQYQILPDKFFYDSSKILNSLYYPTIIDSSYQYAVNFFKAINFMHFTTLQQWSVLITIVFLPIIVFFLIKNNKYNFHQFLFVIASVALLDIYVFNISKDILQFLYFLVIYLILKLNIKNFTKLILCCLVLLYEALNFRLYYAIMAMIMVTIYFIYNIFLKNKKINIKKVILILFVFIFAFLVEVFFVKLISYSHYESILSARFRVNINRQGSLDAVTIINDLLGKNTSFIIFSVNYIINFVRLNIPIELLFKGIKYIPFVVYQIYILIQVIINLKKINYNNLLWLDVVISFIMISVIFEPDFGSFLRHESALMLILLELSKINNNECVLNLDEQLDIKITE